MEQGPVWIIDADLDDQEFVKYAWESMHLPYELRFFKSANEVMSTLASIQQSPFIIICDVRLPGVDGMELREKMLKKHSEKFHSVPFILWSESSMDKQIAEAYKLSIHGFFIKGSSPEELRDTFQVIIKYWNKSLMPGKNGIA